MTPWIASLCPPPHPPYLPPFLHPPTLTFLWTLCRDLFCGQFLWTRFVDTFYGHFLWTLLCGQHFDTFCGFFVGAIHFAAEIMVEQKRTMKKFIYFIPRNTSREKPGSTDNFCPLKQWDSMCCLFVYLHCIECLHVLYQLWSAQQTNALLSFPELLGLSL